MREREAQLKENYFKGKSGGNFINQWLYLYYYWTSTEQREFTETAEIQFLRQWFSKF
jgi:hypothetical protein